MKSMRILLLSLVITTIVWMIFSWPLPRFFASGVPASSCNVERGGVRRMMAGDHLQMIYNYWLVSDYVYGKHPLVPQPL